MLHLCRVHYKSGVILYEFWGVSLKETSRRFVITLGTKFKNLLSLGGKITMFSKFITNYIEQG